MASRKRRTIAVAFDYRSDFHRAIWTGLQTQSRKEEIFFAHRMAGTDIVDGAFDGVIYCSGTSMPLHEIKLIDLPKVDAGGLFPAVGNAYVGVDEDQLGRLAANHFIERGFHRFAFYTNLRNPCPPNRKEAFYRALGSQRPFCVEPPQHTASDRRFQQHEKMMSEWIRSVPKPIAILAGSDEAAAWLTYLCSQGGIRIPEEVGLLGVGNDEILCRANQPHTSSIELPGHAIGVNAGEILSRIISRREHRQNPAHVHLPPLDVVCRHSTDALNFEDELVAAALRFMRAHAAENFGIDDVAQAVGIGRRTLEVRCKNATQKSLLHHIHAIRVEKAKQLLLHTDLKTEAVAAGAGFSSPLQMRRALAEFRLPAPSQLRRELGRATKHVF
jgi:LacI family transcriptional regulator